MTQEVKKSSVLTDDDYRAQKTWTYNAENLARQTVNLGGPYQGILEAVQNALDSPKDPERDYNKIEITIPMLGDSEYKRVVARIRDLGESVTKLHNGNISGYINAEKAVSLKGNDRFGLGQSQYINVSPTILQISQDDNLIYKIPIFKNKDGLPTWGNYIVKPITAEYQKKYNIFHKGTVLEWYDPYENMPDLNPFKVGKEIQKTFGWKMMKYKNTEIYINDQRLEIHEDLRDHEIRWICNLEAQIVEYPNGKTEKVSPKVEGFIYYDKKGRGMLRTHAGGGYYIDNIRYAEKRFSGAINIIGMPIDVARRMMTHEAMKLDLEKHILELTKSYPDIPKEGEDITTKQEKGISNYLNKVLSPFNLPKKLIEKLEIERKKRIEEQGDPTGDDYNGYPKPKPKDNYVGECQLCGHFRIKNLNGVRAGCKCKCHIPRPKAIDKKKKRAGENGDTTILREIEERNDKNKPKSLEIIPLRGRSEEDPLLELTSSGQLGYNPKNPLFKFYEMDNSKNYKAWHPHLTSLMMDFEYPQGMLEMGIQEFRKLEQQIEIKIMEAAKR